MRLRQLRDHSVRGGAQLEECSTAHPRLLNCGTLLNDTNNMADGERKQLTWKIKKDLHKLTAEELFEVVENITPVPDVNSSEVTKGDEESCYDYICAYLNCKTLLEAEDEGLSHLLLLKDVITEILALRTTPTLTKVVQQGNGTKLADTSPTEFADPQAVEYEKLMANYVAIGRKLSEFKTTTAQRTLSFLQRREFKVHGGQVGDTASDISYHGLCKQIDEGLKAKYTEDEIIQGVLRIVKPGHFRVMLTSKNLNLSKLKSLMRSHLSEKSGSELFQELMSTKQHENESPQ